MSSVDYSLNPEEMERMIKACEEPREKLVIACTMLFGMREGEIKHMREEWLSYQNNKIMIPSTQPCDCWQCKGEWHPKTKRGARSIPMWHEWGKGAVKGYFSIRKDSGIKSRKTIYNIVQKIAERARVQRHTYPHGLRATAATHFAEMGMSAQGLCEVMGWIHLGTATAYITRLGKTAERELNTLKENSLV